MTFEESLTRLEKIVRELDDGKITLDDALAKYEEGIVLLKNCNSLLEGAERKIELLRGVTKDGKPVLEPIPEENVKTQVFSPVS